MRKMVKRLLYENPICCYAAKKIHAYNSSLKVPLSSREQLVEKCRFVIVIPAYNALEFCRKNVLSAIEQRYTNFRIHYIDDSSTDGSFDAVKSLIAYANPKISFTFQSNEKNQGALKSLYDAIHNFADDEIVVSLDGDDWLAHDRVLQILNAAYFQNDTWMTYGQYIECPSYTLGSCRALPKQLLTPSQSHKIRKYPWVTSHLRTFYAGLFKKIRLEDLIWDGELARVSWDFAMMLPMLEMALEKAKFISDILHVYNNDQPLNDHKLRPKAQQDAEHYFRSLKPYKPLKELFE